MMKYIKTIIGALVATALLATVVNAAPSTNAPVVSSEGQWTLSLSGTGATATKSPSDSVIGAQIALGHTGKLILPLEAGVRQGFGYASANGGTALFSTSPFVDWTVLKLGNLEFDLGGNVGATYGNTPLTWKAAPEGVVRLYLKQDVDLFGRIEYPFALNGNNGPVAQDSLVYTIGLRVKF